MEGHILTPLQYLWLHNNYELKFCQFGIFLRIEDFILGVKGRAPTLPRQLTIGWVCIMRRWLPTLMLAPSEPAAFPPGEQKKDADLWDPSIMNS